jgi:hypothetical protein
LHIALSCNDSLSEDEGNLFYALGCDNSFDSPFSIRICFCAEHRHPVATRKNNNSANAFPMMARYAIAGHARTLTRPGAAAKMRLRARFQERPPAAFAGRAVALTDNP